MKCTSYALFRSIIFGVLSVVIRLSWFTVEVESTFGQTITLSNGPVEGCPRDANGILSFKGIPYAQPPLGNLRWHAPQPAIPWPGTLNTTNFGNSCYANRPGIPYFAPPSEDCLYLNVWTGAQQATEKRPVMVWIPGGGFVFGSAAQPTYGGSNLAAEGVVVVTINYRLGVFGFLALEELDNEGTSSGNFALQDILLALSWVKSNIAAFGGDPDNVTLFGESAGAMAVGLLMSSPLSTGLFHKAIMESGAFWDSEAGPLETFAQARQRGMAFEQKVGASNVAQLRAMSAVAIINATVTESQFHVGSKNNSFSPGIDNYVLPTQPGTVFFLGQQMDVPLLAGWNADEQGLFLPLELPTSSAANYEAAAELYFGHRLSQFLTLYPDSNSTQLKASADALIGDMVIREQTWTAVDMQRRRKGLLPNSVWAYYFTYTSLYSPVASHSSELAFVFGNFEPHQPPPTLQDVAISKTMRAYWTNFAKTGNPNAAGLPTWPAYVVGGADILELGTTVATANYDLSRLEFIASFRTEGQLPESWRNVNYTHPLEAEFGFQHCGASWVPPSVMELERCARSRERLGW